jgi:diguanylate cyclase (GGDEF)-like protein
VSSVIEGTISTVVEKHVVETQASKESVTKILSDSELFAGFGPKRIDNLVKVGTFCECPAGEVLFREGETGEILYLVLSGSVAVTTEADPDKVFRLKEGDLVGEIGLLDGLPRTATVTTETPCQLFRLTLDDLESFLQTEPDTALPLMRAANRKVRAALGREKELNASLRDANQELERLNNSLEIIVSQKTEQLRRSVENLTHIAETDPLTGVYNRRKFDELMVKCLGSSEKMSLILLDVDHFKKLNDTHGHQAGDRVLIKVAEVSNACLGEGQYLARYGGEEFGIILPGADTDEALSVAERVRRSIEEFHFPIRGCLPGYVRASLGVSTYPKQAESVVTLIEAADKALYQAKENGRNRVEVLA